MSKASQQGRTVAQMVREDRDKPKRSRRPAITAKRVAGLERILQVYDSVLFAGGDQNAIERARVRAGARWISEMATWMRERRETKR